MSFIYSRALVEAYSQANCSDTRPSALLNGSHTPPLFLPSDKTTAFSRLSRFGMTFGHLTDDLGAELLTWWQEDSRVRRSAQQIEAGLSLKTFGQKCEGSWQMSLPHVSLPRTFRKGQLKRRPMTLNRWVTKSVAHRYQRRTWVQTMFGRDFGYLHTPTATANFCAPSMQKHPSCVAWLVIFGHVSPGAFEYLMGWPEGWTDLKPLATVKSRSAPQKHSECSLRSSEVEAA